MEAITLEGEEAIFMERIRQSAQFNDPVVKALKALAVGELRSDEWTRAEGVGLYRGKVYVPDNPLLCNTLALAHPRPPTPHPPTHSNTLSPSSSYYRSPLIYRN